MKTKRFWRVAIPVCIALWTLFIWGQSLVPAEKSTADSQVVEHFFTPEAQQITVEPQWWTHALSAERVYPIPLTFFVRKAAHLAEFAMLGALWALCRRMYPLRLTWGYGLVAGAIDEGIQFFVPGRSSVWSDVVIDTVGHLCGWALITLIIYIWCKMKK